MSLRFSCGPPEGRDRCRHILGHTPTMKQTQKRVYDFTQLPKAMLSR